MTTSTIDLLDLSKDELINWFKEHHFYKNAFVIKLKEINDYSDFELDKILNIHYQLSLNDFRDKVKSSKDLNENRILLKILSDKVKERILFEKHRNSRYFSSSYGYNFLRN
jgi:hypothetical protein